MDQLKRRFKEASLTSKRILLVDDEKDLGLIMKEVFRDAGHKFLFATTVKDGMAKFKKSKNLDIAIVDLRLGKDSGLKFVRKARMINDKVNLIMLSAFGTPIIKNRAKRLGVRHFLDKPIKPERLLDIINRESV